jgi:hypothetical protein
LQSKLCNSPRFFVSASVEEVLNRLPLAVQPKSQRASDKEVGDELFDAWTFSERPDGSIDLSFTEKGTRTLIGLHKSWMEIAKAGNNLIIDYTFHDQVLLKHLLTQLTSIVGRKLDRLIVIEFEESLSSLTRTESTASNDRFPPGFVLSTFKKQKELKQINFGAAHRCTIKATEQTEAATDTAYRFIRKTALL